MTATIYTEKLLMKKSAKDLLKLERRLRIMGIVPKAEQMLKRPAEQIKKIKPSPTTQLIQKFVENSQKKMKND